MIQLIKESLIISFKKIRVYNLEFIMMLFHFIFNLIFMLLFWSAILSNFSIPNHWTNGELYLFSAFVLLGSGFEEIFFGFRNLPYDITQGQLDQYLIRPRSTILLYLLQNLNIISVLEQICIALITCIIIILTYNIQIHFMATIIALFLLIIGVISYQLLYGAFSLLSFWQGNIVNFREIIFSLSDIKKYPLNFFKQSFINFFTFIFPIALITYYPISIFLNKETISLFIVCSYILILIVTIYLFNFTWKRGIKRYEANN